MRPRGALHGGSQYIIAGLHAPEHSQGSRASAGTCTGLGWRRSLGSGRSAVTPTDNAHDNPQSQQAFFQHGVTSHKPCNATGRDDKKLFV